MQDNLLCRIEGQDQELAKGGEDEVTMMYLYLYLVLYLYLYFYLYLYVENIETYVVPRETMVKKPKLFVTGNRTKLLSSTTLQSICGFFLSKALRKVFPG